MNLLKKGLFPFLVVLVALAGFYFFYYQKTPEYSLLAIQQAYKNQDLAKFQKHVDLDKVLSNFYDDVVAEQLEGMEFEEGRMITGLSKLLKKPFVNAAKDNILQEFSKERPPQLAQPRAEQTEPATGQSVGSSTTNEKKNLFKNLADRLKPNKMDYKGMGKVRIEGDTAYVEIILHDTKLLKDYTFTAQMTKLSDRTWRLVRLQNVNSYLRDLLGDKLSS